MDLTLGGPPQGSADPQSSCRRTRVEVNPYTSYHPLEDLHRANQGPELFNSPRTLRGNDQAYAGPSTHEGLSSASSYSLQPPDDMANLSWQYEAHNPPAAQQCLQHFDQSFTNQITSTYRYDQAPEQRAHHSNLPNQLPSPSIMNNTQPNYSAHYFTLDPTMDSMFDHSASRPVCEDKAEVSAPGKLTQHKRQSMPFEPDMVEFDPHWPIPSYNGTGEAEYSSEYTLVGQTSGAVGSDPCLSVDRHGKAQTRDNAYATEDTSDTEHTGHMGAKKSDLEMVETDDKVSLGTSPNGTDKRKRVARKSLGSGGASIKKRGRPSKVKATPTANDLDQDASSAANLPSMMGHPAPNNWKTGDGIRVPIAPPKKQDGMFFDSFAEAQSAMGGPAWTSPPDDIVPTTPAELKPYAKRLYDAMVDMTQFEDQITNRSMQKRWLDKDFGTTGQQGAVLTNDFHMPHVLEHLAWETADAVQRLHLNGAGALNCRDAVILEDSFQDSALTFEQRISLLIDVCTKRKSRVGLMMEGSAVSRYALVPSKLLKQSDMNSYHNSHRQGILKEGRDEYREKHGVKNHRGRGAAKSKSKVKVDNGDETSSPDGDSPVARIEHNGADDSDAPSKIKEDGLNRIHHEHAMSSEDQLAVQSVLDEDDAALANAHSSRVHAKDDLDLIARAQHDGISQAGNDIARKHNIFKAAGRPRRSSDLSDMRSSELEKLTTQTLQKRKRKRDPDEENDDDVAQSFEEQNKKRKYSHTDEAEPVEGKGKGKAVAKRGRKK